MAVLGGIIRGTNVLDNSSRSNPNAVASIAGGLEYERVAHSARRLQWWMVDYWVVVYSGSALCSPLVSPSLSPIRLSDSDMFPRTLLP